MADGTTAGRLVGVGVGPGDPELITIKARNAIESAAVIAYPGAEHGSSLARRIADPYIAADQIELALRYPVTTGTTDHPGGYEVAVSDFYDESAERLAEHLDAGRDVAVLCEGDPFLYGSYMYLHDRLSDRYECQVIPGVTSFSAAAAAAGTPLVRRDDVLTILPGTLAPDQLAARLATSDAAVVMKLGRTFPGVRDAAERAQVLARGIYVERASTDEQRIEPLPDVGGTVPYMSLVLIPAQRWPRTAAAAVPGRATVSVVGLGPGGPEWLTPEAHAELAGADVLIGYDTYLRRVPERHGQRRLASDNRVEAERAREALALASAGERVAVVSSGDPGIFAMAAAVLEACEACEGPVPEVRIVPGMSAMQAVAARVGAPLGHDFCVISLSDQRKPWEVIERRLEAAGAADLVLALYNPASRSRRSQLDRAVEVLRTHRTDDTPVVVARAVGSPEEAITVSTLADLDTSSVDMRTLLIIGSSTTRTIPGHNGHPQVYTPRGYPAPA
jgi:precorrin-2 C20-methyltransferase/precorrin-3B C17-methyltransferase